MSRSLRFIHVITGEEVTRKLPAHGSRNMLISNMILKKYVRAGKSVSHTEGEKFLLRKAAEIKFNSSNPERQVSKVSYKKVLAVIGGGEKVTEEGVVK